MRRSATGTVVVFILFVWSAAVATRQSAAPQDAPALNLTSYEGQYDYQGNTTLFIVASEGRLIAILGDGKYPLRASGRDTFVNATGDAIPFARDASGRVVAFK